MVWNECVTKAQEYGHRECKECVVISPPNKAALSSPPRLSAQAGTALTWREAGITPGDKIQTTLSPEPVAHWKHAFCRFVIEHPVRPGQTLCRAATPCVEAKLKLAEFNMAAQKTNQTRGGYHWGNASACKRPSGTPSKSTQVYNKLLNKITEFYLVGWRKSLILEVIQLSNTLPSSL